MPQIDTYSAGTVSVTNGSNIVNGAGTAWVNAARDEFAVTAGYPITIGTSYFGIVDEVISPTQIRVIPPWPFASASAQSYKAVRVTRIDAPEMRGFLQWVMERLSGTTALVRLAADSGAVRGIWRDDGSGNFSLFVGNTGAADGAMIEALEFDRTTGAARFRAGTAALPSITPIGDSNTGVFFPGADQVAIATNGATRLQVVENGRVIIGGGTAATASFGLTVRGDAGAGVFGDFDGNGQFIISGSTTPAKRLAMGVDTAAGTMVGVIQSVEAAVAVRPLALNPNGGFVGIATRSPQAPLHVIGAIRSGPDSGTNGVIAMYGDGANATIEAFSASNAGTKRNIGLASYGGNVGIGTTAPATTFHVNGSTTLGGDVFRPNNTGAIGIYGGNPGASSAGITLIGGDHPTVPNRILFTNGAYVARLAIEANGLVQPGSDNSQNFGAAGTRWATIFAGTGTINTSDQSEKTKLRAFSPEEIAAAKELAGSIGVYQWLASVEEKGEDKARLHVGLIAQEVEAVMKRHGLDPWRYGFMCKDPITKRVKKTETRKVQKTELIAEVYTEIEIVDGVPTQVEKTREVKQPVVEMVPVLDKAVKPVVRDVQATEDKVEDYTEIEMRDGKAVQVEKTRTVKAPKFDTVPVVDDRGRLVMTEVEVETGVLGADGKPATRREMRPVTTQVPVMTTEPVLHPVPVMIEETVEIEVDEPAGERLGLRYDQVYGFIIAGMAAA